MSRRFVELGHGPRSGSIPRQRRKSLVLLLRSSLTTLISRVSSNPVKKLEEKLDGIVSLLKASHEIGSAYEHTTTASVRSVSLLDQELKVSSMLPEDLNRSSHVQFAQPGVWSRQLAPTSAPKVQDALARTFNGPEWISSNPLPTEEEAAVLLETFRDETCLFFPFISIPKSTSVGAFRRERPFTYLAIMAVSTMKYPQGSELGKIVIKQVAERVFVDGERSIDLLFGILTLAAWSVPLQNISNSFWLLEYPFEHMLIDGVGTFFTFSVSTILPA